MFPIDDFHNTAVSSNVSTDVSPLSADLRDDFDFKQCSFLRLHSENTEIPMLASGVPLFQRGEASAEQRRRKKENEEKVRKEMAKAEEKTLYKRKGNKVLPADLRYDNGKKPKGAAEWRETRKEKEWYKAGGRFAEFNIPKFSKIERGSRLQPNRNARMRIGTDLWRDERELLMEVPFNREVAIAFDSSGKGRFQDDIEPPHVRPTIPQKPWQAPSFKIPAGQHEVSARMIEDRLACGTIERSFGPYRNPWFLVEKPGFEKNEDGNRILDSNQKPIKSYRLINLGQRINAISIRDPSLPPGADEFSERLPGYPLISLVDLHSGYDQCTLAPESRDITAFHTPLGLMRMTTLPQGYTNDVQAFHRVVKKDLHVQIVRGRCEQFINDIVVRPKS